MKTGTWSVYSKKLCFRNSISVNVHVLVVSRKPKQMGRSSICTRPVHLLQLIVFSKKFCGPVCSYACFVPPTNCMPISGPYKVFLKIGFLVKSSWNLTKIPISRNTATSACTCEYGSVNHSMFIMRPTHLTNITLPCSPSVLVTCSLKKFLLDTDT